MCPYILCILSQFFPLDKEVLSSGAIRAADEKPAAAEHAAEPAAKKPARKTKKATRSTKKSAAESAPATEPEPEPTPEPAPEPEPTYKVRVNSCQFKPGCGQKTSSSNVTINGEVVAGSTTTTYFYEADVTLTVTNIGNQDIVFSTNNFSLLWDGQPLTLDAFEWFQKTTVSPNQTITITLTAPITEEQYNDWAQTEHVILLRGQLGETALSYKYQTKSDRMIVLV